MAPGCTLFAFTGRLLFGQARTWFACDYDCACFAAPEISFAVRSAALHSRYCERFLPGSLYNEMQPSIRRTRKSEVALVKESLAVQHWHGLFHMGIGARR